MSAVPKPEKQTVEGTFVRIYLCDGSAHLVRITREHLVTFGIKSELSQALHRSWVVCREIEFEDGIRLDWANRAAAMCRAGEACGPLPYDQCVRWELLTEKLAELQELDACIGGQ